MSAIVGDTLKNSISPLSLVVFTTTGSAFAPTISSLYLSNNCVTLNFSEEFLNFKDDVQKYNIINSMLDSLTQLNEVDSIKILVNNETIDGLSQEYTTISENP